MASGGYGVGELAEGWITEAGAALIGRWAKSDRFFDRVEDREDFVDGRVRHFEVDGRYVFVCGGFGEGEDE